MITREQYLKALEVIDQYHRQSNPQSPSHEAAKTPISEWLANLPVKPSGRLVNLLTRYRGPMNYGCVEPTNGKPFKYVEDVNEHEFMTLMYAGKTAWQEFVRLRDLNK